MSTPAKVRAFCHELRNTEDTDIQVWLDLAAHWVSSSFWGSKADDALALLAAHLWTAAHRKSAGSVSSMSAGVVSVSFNAPPSNHELATTQYGNLFISLRKTLPSMPFVRR